MAGEHAVIAGHVEAGRRNQGAEAGAGADLMECARRATLRPAASALWRLLTLAHEGKEERDDEAITDASGAALDLDERREVEDCEV